MREQAHFDLATARALVRASLAEQRPGAPHGLGSLAPVDKPRRAQVFCAARPDERIVVKVYAPLGPTRPAHRSRASGRW